MASIAVNREDFTTDYMRKTAKYLVQFCISQGIGTVVVGVNKGQKQGVNIGHVNNQNFVQIPFWKFRRILGNHCKKYGINYIEEVESFTSKSSFLDKDILPEYDPENETKYTFGGRRVQRGLYRSKDGRTVHADINGSANIIRKHRPDVNFSELDKAVLLNPKKVRVLSTARKKPVVKSTAAAQATA